MSVDPFDLLREAREARARAVMATVIGASGSTPQRVGARMVLCALDGKERFAGTVGGGAIENVIFAAMRETLADGKPRRVQRDLGKDLGMCCGGRMDVLVDAIEYSPRLLLFGAGHVAKPLASFSADLGFEVHVIDERAELNNEERFPKSTRHLCTITEAAERIEAASSDWVIIVTHDHGIDEEALEVFGARPHQYVGMIGSQRKVYQVLRRLALRDAVPPLEQVYAPIGLDLGAVSPEEIAVSIAAELVAIRHGKVASHMRVMDDPKLEKVLSGQLSP